jgi:hypothetical protein
VEEILRFTALMTFGVGATFLGSTVLGRLLARRGAVSWVWNRSSTLGYVMLAAGLALGLLGFTQGSTSTGSSLILLGTVLSVIAIWLVR